MIFRLRNTTCLPPGQVWFQGKKSVILRALLLHAAWRADGLSEGRNCFNARPSRCSPVCCLIISSCLSCFFGVFSQLASCLHSCSLKYLMCLSSLLSFCQSVSCQFLAPVCLAGTFYGKIVKWIITYKQSDQPLGCRVIKVCLCTVSLTQLYVTDPHTLLGLLEDFLKVNPSEATWYTGHQHGHQSRKLGARRQDLLLRVPLRMCGPLRRLQHRKNTSYLTDQWCNSFKTTLIDGWIKEHCNTGKHEACWTLQF